MQTMSAFNRKYIYFYYCTSCWQVMASSWAYDLRKQIQQTRFLGFVNRSVSFIRSHVPFVSDPRSKVVDVDMLQSQSPEV